MSAKNEHSTSRGSAGKVGSDPAAARALGGRGDFGLPPDSPPADERVKERATGGAPLSSSHNTTDRTVGVGAKEGGGPGAGSGGDLDPDYIGVGTGGGIAARPTRGVTEGPASSGGGSDEFASGGPARGENTAPRNTIGGGGPVGNVEQAHVISRDITGPTGADGSRRVESGSPDQDNGEQ